MANRKVKSQKSKVKTIIQKSKFLLLSFGFAFLLLSFTFSCFAQDADLEFNLDVATATIPTPKIFRPNIDFSGRGFHRQSDWPQELSSPEVLQRWQNEIGFSGLYRLQFNLWEVNELAKYPHLQSQLLANYEAVFKKITDAGGTLILNIFGTPAGLGKVLDKRSPPIDLVAFKELIKGYMKNFSCDKKYNIWYEVWSGADLEEFFLGSKQEYLSLYRQVAEAAKELERQSSIHIPVGGPGSSWWFQSFEANSVITPEKGLVYDLIRFAYQYRLKLDFVSWHAYFTGPLIEKEITAYKKNAVSLIRAWLSYFHFPPATQLVVDEWNFDSGDNLLAQRAKNANIAASYIPSRLKNMYEAKLDNQVYFSLEDFQANPENVESNTGVFSYDAASAVYKGQPKAAYNVFRMLSGLGSQLYKTPKLENDFIGVLATKEKEDIIILIYNYIDPDISLNYLSRNISELSGGERKMLLGLIKSEKLDDILNRAPNIFTLRTTRHIQALLKKAQALNERSAQAAVTNSTLKINLKKIKGDYIFSRYSVDASCVADCAFLPAEEKEVSLSGDFQESLEIKPYSVSLVILKKKSQAAP